MDKITTGAIHKIILGSDPKNGMNLSVHQKFPNILGGVEITEIVRDESNFYYFGNIRYLVYAKRFNDPEVFVWKHYENVPISVEYDIS